jgi:transcriptional regulator with GAF, ATPase, and Fis domain
MHRRGGGETVHIEAENHTRAYLGRQNQSGKSSTRVHGLAVIAGPGSGARRLIDEEEIRIGKAPGNHFCLPDPTVSRFHCVIEQTPRGLLLRDLGSFNGTQVAGCWVESAYLSPQVPIQLGNTVLQLFVSESGGAAPDPRALGPRVLGTSAAMQSIVSVLPRLALSQATVLLEGETGTGKSMIAELIHRMGPRNAGPFVVVDCGALAPSLIESELFGHEKGSFTGAVDRRLGAFESAQGGTVFLDEIGELPLELQPKLLRAIEDRTVRRLGSGASVQLDVQVIAATNRDLRRAVAAGHFRADLYYRLEAVCLMVPPLRERREDIPQLVDHFCRRTRADIPDTTLQRMKDSFTARPWPGNVRELSNAVERAVLLPSLAEEVLQPEPTIDDFERSPRTDPIVRLVPREPGPNNERGEGSNPGEDPSLAVFRMPFREAKEGAIDSWERNYLSALMRLVHGNISRAARLVQVDRSHLRDLLRRHQIPAGDNR